MSDNKPKNVNPQMIQEMLKQFGGVLSPEQSKQIQQAIKDPNVINKINQMLK